MHDATATMEPPNTAMTYPLPQTPAPAQHAPSVPMNSVRQWWEKFKIACITVVVILAAVQAAALVTGQPIIARADVKGASAELTTPHNLTTRPAVTTSHPKAEQVTEAAPVHRKHHRVLATATCPAHVHGPGRPDRNMTTVELAALACQAGFTGVDLPVAVAVALAESRGNWRSVGDTTLEDTTWGPSMGLWQIRSLREQLGSGGQRDEEVNMDPLTNAQHARQIASTARGWKHWSTVLHGTYLRYLEQATAAFRKL